MLGTGFARNGLLRAQSRCSTTNQPDKERYLGLTQEQNARDRFHQEEVKRLLLLEDLLWCQEACAQLARTSAVIHEFPHCSSCRSQRPCSPGLPSAPAESPPRCRQVNTAASAPLGQSWSEITTTHSPLAVTQVNTIAQCRSFYSLLALHYSFI